MIAQNIGGDFVFYDNYVSLCASVGKTPSGVAKELGIGRSTVSCWKSRGNCPSDVTAHRIADYFGISVADLTGDGDSLLCQETKQTFSANRRIAEKENPAPTDGDGMRTMEEWDRYLDTLNKEQLKTVIDLAMRKFMETES